MNGGRARLLIVGAGGLGRETAELVTAINQQRPSWDLLGFLDDDPELRGSAVAGVPVVGSVDAAAEHADAQVVVATASPADYFSRKRLVRRLGVPADRFATLVHPTAVLPPSCTLGPGTTVLAGVVATTSVELGAHVVLMPGVILTHDDVVGDFATLASGVRLGGGVRVGEGAYLGAGSLVRERRSVGAWSLLGMGAVVTADVPPAEVWVGSPARRLRSVAVPPDVSAGGPVGSERS